MVCALALPGSGTLMIQNSHRVTSADDARVHNNVRGAGWTGTQRQGLPGSAVRYLVVMRCLCFSRVHATARPGTDRHSMGIDACCLALYACARGLA